MKWDMNAFISALIPLSLLFPAVGWSRPISIGGTTIEVPNPPGFVAVTPEMAAVVQARRQLVSPGAECFVSYVAESEDMQALQNELPQSGKVLWIQVAKERSNSFTSQSSFLRIKQLLKAKMPDASKVSPGQLEVTVHEMRGKDFVETVIFDWREAG